MSRSLAYHRFFGNRVEVTRGCWRGNPCVLFAPVTAKVTPGYRRKVAAHTLSIKALNGRLPQLPHNDIYHSTISRGELCR
jgi:hypothetical protein